MNAPVHSESSLSSAGRLAMLTTAFLGWMCAGILMSITSVAMQPAIVDLLNRTGQLDRVAYGELSTKNKAKGDGSSTAMSPEEKERLKTWNVKVGEWVSWVKGAFLFGAAFGGWFFGALGDRFGRTKGMGLAILTYSLFAGVASLADRPERLLVCWFVACTGLGGMWPNGVALVSEAWSSLSRPVSAGIIGMSANIGIFLMSTWMRERGVSPENWAWAMETAALPALLGLISLVCVPESPRWLAARGNSLARTGAGVVTHVAPGIFRRPLVWTTLAGIALATVPIVGGWGCADWMVQWADREGADRPSLKAEVSMSRSITGIVGSFAGGWIASVVGRRRTYFLVSLAALAIAQYTFWCVTPSDATFLVWVSALGLFSGVYFGWLPFCLPEFFPTHARSAGAGVSFNFGRIVTGTAVVATGVQMSTFKGDYAAVGRVTSLIFAVGLVVIWLAPDTSRSQLDD